MRQSLLSIPLEWTGEEEFSETLLSTESLLIERILSRGHVSPKGSWYDQEEDEWVLLLQGNATLVFEDGSSLMLRGGDSVFLPAHRRHRVDYTSSDPCCVWLAIRGSLGS